MNTQSTPFLDLARPWIDRGANVIPGTVDKTPAIPPGFGARRRDGSPGTGHNQWGGPKYTAEQYLAWAHWPGPALVLVGSMGACVLDVDRLDLIERVIAACGPTPYWTSTSRGAHLFYRGVEVSTPQIIAHVDTKSNGAYVVAAGSRHASGHVYTASPELLAMRSVDELPPLAEGWRTALTGREARPPRVRPVLSEAALASWSTDARVRQAWGALERVRPTSTYRVATLCWDYGVPEDIAHELAIHYAHAVLGWRHFDGVASRVENAYAYAQNPFGCDLVASVDTHPDLVRRVMEVR